MMYDACLKHVHDDSGKFIKFLKLPFHTAVDDFNIPKIAVKFYRLYKTSPVSLSLKRC